MKRPDQKIASILADPSGAKDFIIADAKDADMAFGITAPRPQSGSCRRGHSESEGGWKTLDRYLQQIRDLIRQDIVDIVLLSANKMSYK